MFTGLRKMSLCSIYNDDWAAYGYNYLQITDYSPFKFLGTSTFYAIGNRYLFHFLMTN